MAVMSLPLRLGKPELLLSPLFLASLILLILNDHFLKAEFHNWLTGKLSDFAGLAAFAIFACAIWPTHVRRVAAVVTLGFIFWKSSFSQGLIDFAQHELMLPIGRTVDYSDLIALPAAWAACRYAVLFRPRQIPRRAVQSVVAISLLSFTATTRFYSESEREAAVIPRDQVIAGMTEARLETMFDELAAKHGLKCLVCGPIADGRAYIERNAQPFLWMNELAVIVTFDRANEELVYDIRSTTTAKHLLREADVEALYREIKSSLRHSYPRVEFKSAPFRESLTRIELTGFRSAESVGTDKVREIIADVVMRYGMRPGSEGRDFEKGRLLGPRGERELYVQTWWSLPPSPSEIRLVRASPTYIKEQADIANELERRLQAEFGPDRVQVR